MMISFLLNKISKRPSGIFSIVRETFPAAQSTTDFSLCHLFSFWNNPA